ncbi:MAG: CHAT domain-containing protein, partial [Bacteroidetes bacterium]|nr:CHAT domain-containing protein [Bacteroidota bacterium]
RYFTRALELTRQHNTDTAYFVANYINNIASAFRKLEDFDRALSLYKSLFRYKINSAGLTHNIGVTWLDAGRPAAALACLRAVPYDNEVKNNDLGRIFLALHNYDSARHYFQRAMRIRRLSSDRKSYEQAISWKGMGDLFQALHHPGEALRSYQQALIQVCPLFNDSSIGSNPPVTTGMYQYIFLFETLVAKADAFAALGVDAPSLTPLRQAYDGYLAAIELAGHVERLYSTDESRLFLKKRTAVAYRAFTKTALRLYRLTGLQEYLRQAFIQVELNKASVLRTGLHELDMAGLPGIPAALLEREKQLKKDIDQLYVGMRHTADTSGILVLEKNLRDLAMQLETVQRQLDSNPGYLRLKFTGVDIDPDRIALALKKQDAGLLSYFNTGNELVCFYIAHGQLGYVSGPETGQLSSSIGALRQELRAMSGYDRVKTQALSRYLFGRLLSPVANKLRGLRRLVIIPHNEIGHLSFDMLTDPADGKPLVRRFATSYLYSLAFFEKSQSATVPYNVLALAPFGASVPGNVLPPLKASVAEVKDLPGKVLLNAHATKQQFVNLAAGYPILHLATHASAGADRDESPFIAFYPATQMDTGYRLYQEEIYHLRLQRAGLVVLSACETGEGQLVGNEGVMSLSRAFSYAGCGKVIASLWKTDDEATGFITRRLHYYLHKGLPVDESLQQAKIDFLDRSDINAQSANPAYWSPLILIGDVHPVAAATSLWWVYTLSVIVAIALLLAIKSRRRRKPAA